MRALLIFVLSTTLFILCGGDSDDTPPPPPSSAQPAPAPTPAAPAGQVMVTVVANSNPPGAAVMGGGRPLGLTPLQTQVPIPAPQPGQPQMFAFTFTLDGYQTATLNAAPVNNTISITAALAPIVPTTPEPVPEPTSPNGNAADGEEIRINGRGGGPIYDNHTTTGQATVTQDCTIQRLRVRLNGEHTYFGDLHISLRSPSGRSYSLARGGNSNPFRTHTVRRVVGQNARGRWRLSIEDRLREDSGILRSWQLLLTCR